LWGSGTLEVGALGLGEYHGWKINFGLVLGIGIQLGQADGLNLYTHLLTIIQNIKSILRFKVNAEFQSSTSTSRPSRRLTMAPLNSCWFWKLTAYKYFKKPRSRGS
jgi:hypothetical protein